MFKAPVSLTNLTQLGKSLRAIERETGISHQRLSEYSRGLKSTPKTIKKQLDNYWRSTNYNQLREKGLSSFQARQARDYSFSKSEEFVSLVNSRKEYLKSTLKTKEGIPISSSYIDACFAKSEKGYDEYKQYEEL